MTSIGPNTTLVELAALVSQALERAGLRATLSGGGAVSVYSENEYESKDLDFVSNERLEAIGQAVAPLGFTRVGPGREFENPETSWYLEFPPGPLAFGETSIADDEADVLGTDYGPLRIISPTHVVMDRLAAYVHWRDNPSLDQAVMIARWQDIDWAALGKWAEREKIASEIISAVKNRSR
ncbi:MAG: hypothetical protein U1E22_10750 [Coriobacteriia bacterium]|nr:hypothetical protein [Coriobacteriia bacterium]